MVAGCMDTETFGGWLARRLVTGGFRSQRAFAKAIDMDPTYLSRIINGHVARPERETLEKMARHLGISYEEIAREAGALPDLPLGLQAHGGDGSPPRPTDDDAILADLWAQFQELAPPESIDMLRQMKEQETPEVYAQALRVIVEAFVAAAQIGGTMRRLPRTGGTNGPGSLAK